MFPLARMKDFVERSMAGVSENWRKRLFPLAGIPFPLPGIFLKNWIPLNFINGFREQKERSKISFH